MWATGVMPFWSLRSTHASCVLISTASFFLTVVLHWREPEAAGGACSVTPFNKLEGSLVVALDLFFSGLFSCCHGGGREEKGKTRLSCRRTCSVRPYCPRICKKTSCVQVEMDEGDPGLIRWGIRRSYGAHAGWPALPTIRRIFGPNGGQVSFLPALKPEGEAVLLQQGFRGGHAGPSDSFPAPASILSFEEQQGPDRVSPLLFGVFFVRNKDLVVIFSFFRVLLVRCCKPPL